MVDTERLKGAQAVREEQRKIALERIILPSIKSTFSQMVSEYVAALAETSSVPRASDFQGEWGAIFLKHYRRVGKLFLPNQRKSFFCKELASAEKDLTPQENQELIASYNRWSREFGVSQSAFVTETNQKDYAAALAIATEEAEGASPLVIATAAGVALRRLFRARAETIANVQTQAPAEEAKRQEAVALNASEGRGEEEMVKIWQTVGDANVRVAHVAANGQQRQANEAFSVGGEDLRFPGDSSLGASAANVINCRCAAIWL